MDATDRFQVGIMLFVISLRWLLFLEAVTLFACIHQMGYCLLSVAAGIAAALSLLLSFGIWYATKD